MLEAIIDHTEGTDLGPRIGSDIDSNPPIPLGIQRMLRSSYYIHPDDQRALQVALKIFNKLKNTKNISPAAVKCLTKPLSYLTDTMDEEDIQKLFIFNLQGAAKLRKLGGFKEKSMRERKLYSHFLSHAADEAILLYKRYKRKENSGRQALKWAQAAFKMSGLFQSYTKGQYRYCLLQERAEAAGFLYKNTGRLSWLISWYNHSSESARFSLNEEIALNSCLAAGTAAIYIADEIKHDAICWLERAHRCYSDAADHAKYYGRNRREYTLLKKAELSCDLFLATADKRFAERENMEIDSYLRYARRVNLSTKGRLLFEKDFLRVFLGNKVRPYRNKSARQIG